MNFKDKFFDDEPDGWHQWAKFVLAELERLNSCYEQTRKNIEEIKVAVAQLQIKAGIFGAIGGFIPVALVIILQLLMRK
jgi:hypothetical protein